MKNLKRFFTPITIILTILLISIVALPNETHARQVTWKIVKKEKVADTRGKWVDCGGDISNNGSITCSKTRTYSNSYSAGLKVSKKALDANVGFNTTLSRSVTISKTMKTPSKGRWKIVYRPVYTTYKVTQRQKAAGRWTNKYQTVTVKKYRMIEYDIKKY